MNTSVSEGLFCNLCLVFLLQKVPVCSAGRASWRSRGSSGWRAGVRTGRWDLFTCLNSPENLVHTHTHTHRLSFSPHSGVCKEFHNKTTKKVNIGVKFTWVRKKSCFVEVFVLCFYRITARSTETPGRSWGPPRRVENYGKCSL